VGGFPVQQKPIFVTRQSPDWQGLASDFARGRYIDPARFRPVESITGFPYNIVELIALWNTYMSLDFFTCRSRLQTIADDALAQVACVQRISYEQLDTVTSQSENFVLFFHDDDDWFAPDMAAALSEIPSTEYDVCVFPLIRIWTDTLTFVRPEQNARVIVGRKCDFTFRYQSNNYGISSNICDLATMRAMKEHIAASDYADKHALRDVYVDKIISVTAKTPCSASMLQDILSEPNKAREHVRRYVEALSALVIPAELGWVADRVKCLIDLFSQVLSEAPRARVSTTWGTVFYVDAATGELRHGLQHGSAESSPENAAFLVSDGLAGQLLCDGMGFHRSISCFEDQSRLVSDLEPESQLTMFEIVEAGPGLVGLKAEGRFLCAEPDGQVTLSRPHCEKWEHFRLSNAGFGSLPTRAYADADRARVCQSALNTSVMPSLAGVSDLLRARRPPAAPFIVAVTGSVAAGKSAFAAALAAEVSAWPERPRVEIVATDGFLLDNAALEALGLSHRKGFPESYDMPALRDALAQIRRGPARFPGYSHAAYDIDPALARTLDPPDVLIVEGLGLHLDQGAAEDGRPPIDALIYIDADVAHLEAWFTARFMELWAAAERDETSFYARFRDLDEAAARGLAKTVWESINLPNLRDHIAAAREHAHIVIRKGPDHSIEAIDGRWT
jgi:type I pantothenate kinase